MHESASHRETIIQFWNSCHSDDKRAQNNRQKCVITAEEQDLLLSHLKNRNTIIKSSSKCHQLALCVITHKLYVHYCANNTFIYSTLKPRTFCVIALLGLFPVTSTDLNDHSE
jgi:hypothetical protein